MNYMDPADITPAMVKKADKILATPVAKMTPARAAALRWAKAIKSVLANDHDAWLNGIALAGVPMTFAEHDFRMRHTHQRFGFKVGIEWSGAEGTCTVEEAA